jgi:cobalt-zinc-cadmium resistance protein CzcA
MSLGAIDFGLIVDGAVIIVENCVRHLSERFKEQGTPLNQSERLDTILKSSIEVRRASQFGELMIIAAYIPIISLTGIEGKMFKPMAFTVILALSGALILSFTLIPALCALFLKSDRQEKPNRVLETITSRYDRLLRAAFRKRKTTLFAAIASVVVCLALFPLLGAEFLPDIDEGAIAINHVRLKSVSLTESVRQTTQIESALMKFPEVQTTVSRIGRPEIATDPMGPEMVDTYVFLKPKDQWRPGMNSEKIVEEMSETLESFPGVVASFSQPIKFRMMELVEGVGARSDIVLKLYGDDMSALISTAKQIAAILKKVEGSEDVKVQQITGLPVLEIEIDRDAVARYGISVADVQQVIETAIAGTEVTQVMEGFMKFALVVRYPASVRSDPAAFSNLLVAAPGGEKIPLGQLASIKNITGPAQFGRENGRRLITVESNVRGRDIGSFVAEARKEVNVGVRLPTGYTLHWSGTFEHLESGRNRLLLVVPVTFLLIFLLLFTTFQSFQQAALVFTGIPFALTGGILALLFTGIHFSMSAGIGFIAVSGVAVLNGVVMLTFINQLRQSGSFPSVMEATFKGALVRLRPVLMTAMVATVGFLPMAISRGTGAEVQRPLATVVIGGIITSTLLTLIVLPTAYAWLESKKES